MRKLIVFTAALALAGSVSYAMEEDKMDEMMEAPAPSVTVGASGKIGLKNVDDNDDTTEDFQLVRAYKVTFDSTGTTDGGLMFGAGMSIRDDTGEEDMPVVKGSYVFVGGADGSWKLQFGGNDPGIDLAGGFGVAADHFSGDQEDATIAFSGSFGDTSFRISAADPENSKVKRSFNSNNDTNIVPATKSNLEAYQNSKLKDNNWSVGVSHAINNITVGVGRDSVDGLAVGVGTELSGVNTFLYWSKSERSKVILGEGWTNTGEQLTTGTAHTMANDIVGTQENTGLGVKASMSAGEGATFSVAYSTLKLEQNGMHGDADTGTAEAGDVLLDGVAKTKKIEVDFTYDLGGGATLTAGIDKLDMEEIEADTSAVVAGVAGHDGDTDRMGNIKSSDKTTLEVAIAFSF